MPAMIGSGRPYWVRQTARFWSVAQRHRRQAGGDDLVDAVRGVALGLGEGAAHVDGVDRAAPDVGPLGQLAGHDDGLTDAEGEEDRVLAQADGVRDAQVVEQLLGGEVAGQQVDRLQARRLEVGDGGREGAGPEVEALDVDDHVLAQVARTRPVPAHAVSSRV